MARSRFSKTRHIVAYTIAKFAHLVLLHSGKFLDFKALWNRQALTPAVEQQLLLIAESMFEIIVAPQARFQNVTEWCKKELCWQRARDKEIPVLKELRTELTEREEHILAKKEAQTRQSAMTGIQIQTVVFELGAAYWQALQAWGRQRQLLSPSDESFVKVASGMPGKLPTEKQCVRLLELKTRLEHEGYLA